MPVTANTLAIGIHQWPTTPAFSSITCQVGAESSREREVAERWPEFRFAYSRPGFLTFKPPAGTAIGGRLRHRVGVCARLRARDWQSDRRV